MRVKNVNGSSRFKPSGYTSWLNYWETQAGSYLSTSTYYICPACGKSHLKKNFNGAHVQKCYSPDNTWHIVPLCDGCNCRTDNFDVPLNLLVPVPSNL